MLCTVQLARRVLSREEAPSVRLAALARLFAVATEPTHRALDDARATVDVLHALIERVGNQGVHSYADLRSYLPNVSSAQRRKRVLAEDLPRRASARIKSFWRAGHCAAANSGVNRRSNSAMDFRPARVSGPSEAGPAVSSN